ncbi:hypothetical protein WICPIJ_009102 [Wickerhamomyces pijperi]|uniref:Uncharacterized protein n=1 Tax=Wickerhamomyces pijperi TaxID=599730 RepID=A0A9P8TFI2_WICPI|nr:hypothetical protein WICPIJ_009102 [Wickerhamomyces pijperi]
MKTPKQWRTQDGNSVALLKMKLLGYSQCLTDHFDSTTWVNSVDISSDITGDTWVQRVNHLRSSHAIFTDSWGTSGMLGHGAGNRRNDIVRVSCGVNDHICTLGEWLIAVGG